MMWPRAVVVAALSALSLRAHALDGGPTANGGAFLTVDAGTPEESRDPALVESLEREREDRLMRARAFEARAQLERDLAAKEKNGEVKRKLLDSADRLASQADEERRLADKATSTGN